MYVAYSSVQFVLELYRIISLINGFMPQIHKAGPGFIWLKLGYITGKEKDWLTQQLTILVLKQAAASDINEIQNAFDLNELI